RGAPSLDTGRPGGLCDGLPAALPGAPGSPRGVPARAHDLDPRDAAPGGEGPCPVVDPDRLAVARGARLVSLGLARDRGVRGGRGVAWWAKAAAAARPPLGRRGRGGSRAAG